MKKRTLFNIFVCISAFAMLLSSCNKEDLKGPPGEQGVPGEQGQPGQDGRSVVSVELTSSEGNVDTYTITYSDGTTSTFTVTNGEDGEQGIQGNPGQDGHTPEITIGDNGNWFVDGVDTGIKAQGPQGPIGPQGPQGPEGPQGQPGADGTNVLTGSGVPSNLLGKNGDSYIDLLTWDYYVKENGVWVLKGNIKGQDGSNLRTATVTFDTKCDYLVPSQNHYIGEFIDRPTDPVRLGYTFDYWYFIESDDCELKWLFNAYTIGGDMTLYAQWNLVWYSIAYNLDGGTLPYDAPTSYSIESDYSLPVPTRQNHTFTGWKCSGTDISAITPGRTGELTLTATWEYSTEWKNIHGINPVISPNGSTLTYGLYPQSRVTNSSLINSIKNNGTLNLDTGWYLYDDDYYASVYATPYSNGYVFNDGATIVAGEEYWFKCEAINWKVLESSDNTYFILATVLLDAHCFYHENVNRTINGETIYPNNYEYSDLREWLNDDFYQNAFGFNNSYIQKTEIDNSTSTTDSESNPYVCNNTEDYVYLPTYKDYLNPDYGFSSSTSSHSSRYCYTTDYARARGAVYSSDSSHKFSGHYYSRSPRSTLTYDAWGCGWNANVVGSNITYSQYGVRPSITIKIG